MVGGERMLAIVVGATTLVTTMLVILFVRWHHTEFTTWAEVAAMEHLTLNFGGGFNRHRHSSGRYERYVAVESPSADMGWCTAGFKFKMLPVQGFFGADGYCGNWCVCSKIPGRFELADGTVDRIHSEDCFEHIPESALPSLLVEFHRVLKPGGRVRLGMPDYNNPKDRPYTPKPSRPDPRNTLHITGTTYSMLKTLVEASPFAGNAKWIHYWDDTRGGQPVWVQNKLDLAQGYIKRAVDVDARNTPENPLHVTSLVVDLHKRPSGKASRGRHSFDQRPADAPNASRAAHVQSRSQ